MYGIYSVVYLPISLCTELHQEYSRFFKGTLEHVDLHMLSLVVILHSHCMVLPEEKVLLSNKMMLEAFSPHWRRPYKFSCPSMKLFQEPSLNHTWFDVCSSKLKHTNFLHFNQWIYVLLFFISSDTDTIFLCTSCLPIHEDVQATGWKFSGKIKLK